MSGSNSTVKVSYLGDASSLNKASRSAQGDLDKVSAKVKRSSTAIKAGFAVAAVAVFTFAKGSIKAFGESEQASAKLDDALARFPKTNDRSRASFDKLNASLAKKTKFDDDATASGQAVLAQFKLTGRQIQDMTPLLQDYAAKTGTDLPTAAGVLGKALLGKGKALAGVGVKFKDAGTVSANYTQITEGLRTQVGGFAEKEGKTAAGQAEILENQFGELQETVGSKLVPALRGMAEKLLSIVDFAQRNSAVIGPLVAVVGGLAVSVWAVNAAGRAYAATQAALNVVMSANPIGLVVLAVAALAVGLTLAWQKSETFKSVVITAFQVVSLGVLGIIKGLLKGMELFARASDFVLGTNLRKSVQGAIKDVDGLIKKIQGIDDKTVVINVVTKLNPALHTPGFIGPTIAESLSKQGIAGPYSPTQRGLNPAKKRAGGGPVSAGHPYLVGEREPELFVPNTSGRILNQQQMARAGSSTVILARESVVELAAAIVSGLQRGVAGIGRNSAARVAY